MTATDPAVPEPTDEQIENLWLYRKNIHGGELMPQLQDFARAVLALNGVKGAADSDLPRLVFEAVGSASMCWKGGTGDLVFDSELGTEVAEKLIADVRALYAIPAVLALAAPAVQAERRTCPTCGTHEVSVEVTCHNSACSAYASGITVYEGWKHPPAAQSAAPAVPTINYARLHECAQGLGWDYNRLCAVVRDATNAKPDAVMQAVPAAQSAVQHDVPCRHGIRWPHECRDCTNAEPNGDYAINMRQQAAQSADAVHADCFIAGYAWTIANPEASLSEMNEAAWRWARTKPPIDAALSQSAKGAA